MYQLSHKRVVNSAYFSPQSGSKILTTSQDNRIRVWDSIFGNLDSPSREIVHSHDFNRHLTPFRAEWDPKVMCVLCSLKLLIWASSVTHKLKIRLSYKKNAIRICYSKLLWLMICFLFLASMKIYRSYFSVHVYIYTIIHDGVDYKN